MMTNKIYATNTTQFSNNIYESSSTEPNEPVTFAYKNTNRKRPSGFSLYTDAKRK